jgi:hypothetical protein
MKKLLLAFLISSVAATGFGAGVRVDAKNWKKLQRFDVATLSKGFDSYVGQLVEVQFNFRGKDIHHLKPGWSESSIWQARPDGGGFVNVRAMVAQKDLRAFKALPTSGAEKTMTIYGRVLRDNEAHFVFIRLIGMNVATDPKGNAVITW